MKKWMRDNLIHIWVISSIVFAFIIHCLFSIVAPFEWLAAKWSAGDILTFVSTVALGLLAVWQNKKFKEESDESQACMEMLTKKANELSAISKIIEYESERISDLKAKKNDFVAACNTEGILTDLSDIGNQPADFKKIYVKIKMDDRVKQIKLCAIELLSELKTYPDGDGVIKLIDIISSYSNCSIELAQKMRTCSPVDDTFTQKADSEREFIKSFSDFICDREITLNDVIYRDLSLEEIKAKYL